MRDAFDPSDDEDRGQRVVWLAALVLVGAIVAAFFAVTFGGGDDDDASDVVATDADSVPTLRWSALPDQPVLYAGWGFGSCGGTAPLVCVDGPNGDGTVELLHVDLTDYPAIQQAVDDHEDVATALAPIAQQYLSGIQADRATTCPEATFRADVQEPATVGGH